MSASAKSRMVYPSGTDTPMCCEMFLACVCAAVGDTVAEDEVVCEIETDKVLSAVLIYMLHM